MKTKKTRPAWQGVRDIGTITIGRRDIPVRYDEGEASILLDYGDDTIGCFARRSTSVEGDLVLDNGWWIYGPHDAFMLVAIFTLVSEHPPTTTAAQARGSLAAEARTLKPGALAEVLR